LENHKPELMPGAKKTPWKPALRAARRACGVDCGPDQQRGTASLGAALKQVHATTTALLLEDFGRADARSAARVWMRWKKRTSEFWR